MTINEKKGLTDYAFRIHLLDCSKFAINWKNGNDVTIFQNGIMINFFLMLFFSLAKLSYWSKCPVNIITGSEVMTISIYKGLTRNLEIGNTPVWFLPNIWRLGWVRNTKFGTSLIRCYWILKNGRLTAFTVSELLRENHKHVTVL